MLSVALRAAPALVATVYGMPELPVPPDWIEIHVGTPLTVQEQLASTLREVEFDPPA